MGKKLSIVIPAYNVGKYLQKCVLSCLNSNVTKEDYDVIIINDGSTDNTPEIAQDLEREFTNVTLYSKANGGLSSARNMGIEKSSGEYILFLDADDWLSNDALVKILDAVKRKPDAIGLNYNTVNEQSGLVTPVHFFEKTPHELLKKINYPMGAQFWVVRKEFLEKSKLKFTLNIYHEDNEYTPRMLYMTKSLYIVQEPVYNYLIRQSGSIISSKNMKKSYDLLKIIENYRMFMNDYVNPKDFTIFYNYIMLALNSCFDNAKQNSKEDKQDLFEYLKQNKKSIPFSRILLSSSKIKYKTESLYALVSYDAFLRKMLGL